MFISGSETTPPEGPKVLNGGTHTPSKVCQNFSRRDGEDGAILAQDWGAHCVRPAPRAAPRHAHKACLGAPRHALGAARRGAKYGVAVTVSRASSDADVRRAYKRVLLKAHPDKGGTATDAQRLTRGTDHQAC